MIIYAVVLSVLVAVSQVDARVPRRRNELVTGGLSTASLTDPKIQSVAAFAANQLGSEYTMTELTSAQTQVVAGTKYHLTMTVTKTIPGGIPKTLECDVKVHEMPWVTYLEVTEHCCRLQVDTVPPA